MRTTFYTNSHDAWAAMLTTIGTARESIYLEMYIFDDTTTAPYDFSEALINAALRGVRVYVILDALGSSNLPKAALTRLTKAGVEVRYYRYLFHRTHRKMLVVDERVAFIGGVNISAQFTLWDDLVAKLHGKAVRSITRSFARAYVACGGRDATLTTLAATTALARTRTWFIEHGIGGKRYTLRKHYEEALGAAEHTVTLVTPYFAPSRWLLAALTRAQERGVQLTILLPAKTDVGIMQRLNYHYAALFARLGARVLFSPTMNHAKAMLVDNKLGVVGSHNLDALSFTRNAESGVFFSSPAAVQSLLAIVQKWEAAAQPYRDVPLKRHWYDPLLITLLQLLQPML